MTMKVTTHTGNIWEGTPEEVYKLYELMGFLTLTLLSDSPKGIPLDELRNKKESKNYHVRELYEIPPIESI